MSKDEVIHALSAMQRGIGKYERESIRDDLEKAIESA